MPVAQTRVPAALAHQAGRRHEGDACGALSRRTTASRLRRPHPPIKGGLAEKPRSRTHSFSALRAARVRLPLHVGDVPRPALREEARWLERRLEVDDEEAAARGEDDLSPPALPLPLPAPLRSPPPSAPILVRLSLPAPAPLLLQLIKNALPPAAAAAGVEQRQRRASWAGVQAGSSRTGSAQSRRGAKFTMFVALALVRGQGACVCSVDGCDEWER
ncbi:hypothetical protein B0H17DRAFT_1211470 [Mycena rosella]|uniref:Uncharacterized protein n=1 Tax=Mycena rosella TaxID=1033263 RepID=A0AAD7G6B9_MYCRO|nr:hypothetical protein B0H17DRAFT_1211470 [Mycena rosella]